MHGRIRYAVLGLILASTLAAPASAEVLLNEVLADPASDWDGDGALDSRDDEWVEIVNTGPDVVSLDGYHLAAADGTLRYGYHGSLGPGEVRVVFGSQSYAWEQSTGHPAFGLRLTNTGGAVGLWSISATDSVMVDCYTYEDHEADDDRSSGRIPDGGPAWFVFDGLNVHDGDELPAGSGCLPSPGNSISCPTPARDATWGGIKKQMR